MCRDPNIHCISFFRTESVESSIAKRWPPLIGHMFITSPVLKVQPEKNETKFTDYLVGNNLTSFNIH